MVIILLLLLSMVDTSFGWSQQSFAPPTPTSIKDIDIALFNRRSFFFRTTTIAVAASSYATISHPKAALAATTAALNQETALRQWKDSVATIDNLLENWDTITSGGGSQKEIGISGDTIRKELGTANFGKDVSPLFQIDKAFKVLRENDEIDLVEFTELSEEFAEVLAQADSMAYSANFAGGSGNPSSNKPKVFTEKARKEVKSLQTIAKSLDKLL